MEVVDVLNRSQRRHGEDGKPEGAPYAVDRRVRCPTHSRINAFSCAALWSVWEIRMARFESGGCVAVRRWRLVCPVCPGYLVERGVSLRPPSHNMGVFPLPTSLCRVLVLRLLHLVLHPRSVFLRRPMSHTTPHSNQEYGALTAVGFRSKSLEDVLNE